MSYRDYDWNKIVHLVLHPWELYTVHWKAFRRHDELTRGYMFGKHAIATVGFAAAEGAYQAVREGDGKPFNTFEPQDYSDIHDAGFYLALCEHRRKVFGLGEVGVRMVARK